MKLITHVRDRVLAAIPQHTCQKLRLRTLSYEEALVLRVPGELTGGRPDAKP